MNNHRLGPSRYLKWSLVLIAAVSCSSALGQTDAEASTEEAKRALLAKKLFAIAREKLLTHPEQVVPEVNQTTVERIASWRIQFGPAVITKPLLKDVEIKPQPSPETPYFGELEVHFTRPATRKVVTDGSAEAEKHLEQFFAKPKYVHKIKYVVEMTFEYRNGNWQELAQSKSNRLTSIPMGTLKFRKSDSGDLVVADLVANE